jgi:hypothetical protein
MKDLYDACPSILGAIILLQILNGDCIGYYSEEFFILGENEKNFDE